jgi:hypothetical protein
LSDLWYTQDLPKAALVCSADTQLKMVPAPSKAGVDKDARRGRRDSFMLLRSGGRTLDHYMCDVELASMHAGPGDMTFNERNNLIA